MLGAFLLDRVRVLAWWPRLQVFFTLLIMVLVLGAAIGLPSVLNAASDSTIEKKRGGIMGDPATKRGLEYGFDKGVSAGKQDKKAELEPDVSRHEAYEDPNKYYRYEFGSRARFVRGFKSGFVGGYKQVFGKGVKVKTASSKSASKTVEPSAVVSKPSGKSSSVSPTPKKHSPRPRPIPDTAGDAL